MIETFSSQYLVTSINNNNKKELPKPLNAPCGHFLTPSLSSSQSYDFLPTRKNYPPALS